jgi:hypothetical protein
MKKYSPLTFSFDDGALVAVLRADDFSVAAVRGAGRALLSVFFTGTAKRKSHAHVSAPPLKTVKL